MPFQKGHKFATGRKKLEVEIEQLKKNLEKNITSEVLIKLANSKVHSALLNSFDIKDIRDLGLPITLKGMTEKRELSVDKGLKEVLKKFK